MLTASVLFGLCLQVFAGERISPPAGALVVGNGHYASIQAAVNALKSTTSEQSIFIEPGTYHEQVTIKSLLGPLTIYGYTTNTGSWSSNQVTLSAAGFLGGASSDDATATLRAETPNFKLYNVNVLNTYGPGHQALAVSANNGNQGYYGCAFRGYQDTLLAESGAQLYANSYIEGAIDFIFGQTAMAWFEKCTIGVLPASYGTITASGRAAAASAGYYVLNNATIGAAPGTSVGAGAYYLGRPWGDYARVAVQESRISDVINSAGWHVWGDDDPRTDHVSFGECGNTGPGAAGKRAGFASVLQEPLEIAAILGQGYETAYYVDMEYV